jgi:lambda repressor-like predicted transcriptional regulator
MAQRELAARAGVDPARISDCCRYGAVPGQRVRKKIAAALDMEPAAIWPDAEQETRTGAPVAAGVAGS